MKLELELTGNHAGIGLDRSLSPLLLRDGMPTGMATLQGRSALNAVSQLIHGGNATEIGTTETKGPGRGTEMGVIRSLESMVPLELHKLMEETQYGTTCLSHMRNGQEDCY